MDHPFALQPQNITQCGGAEGAEMAKGLIQAQQQIFSVCPHSAQYQIGGGGMVNREEVRFNSIQHDPTNICVVILFQA